VTKSIDDLGWTDLQEAHARLKWARQRDARYPTTKAFAGSVGLSEHGYAAYERAPGSSKHTPLSYEQAFPWAQRLRVRWEWLLKGEGAPWIDDSDQRRWSPQAQRIAEMVDSAPEEDQERIARAIELLLRTGS